MANDLKEIAIKNAKPKEKPYQMPDGDGLSLEIAVSGSKLWRLRYQFAGKAVLFAMGAYPAITLREARELKAFYKKLLAQGIDPRQHKANNKAQQIAEATRQQQEAQSKAITFEKLFLQWYDTRSYDWSKSHADKVMQRIKNHLVPYIGALPVDDITTLKMIETLQLLDDAGKTHMRGKVQGIASMIFKFGIGKGLTTNDPTASIVASNTFKAHKAKGYATVTDPKEIAKVMQVINSCDDNSAVCMALRLAPLVFLRPSEIAGLTWDEIDLPARLIRIKPERMKMAKSHLVPLSTQAIKILENRQEYKTCQYVFYNLSTYEAINPESLRTRMRRLGIDKATLTTHGFRHMASTRLNEMGFSTDAIEVQLSHTEKDSSRRAYNFADYLDERKRMMQEWADFLEM